MKKVLFLLISCVLLIALALPACAAPVEEAKTIKIGVIGPMEYVQGEHHWWGAEIGRDTVNAAGGVTIGDEVYMIELVKADSNEILSVDDSAAAMERLCTVDQVDFVVGGFRTEGVFAMQEVAMDYQMVFLDCGAATLELCTVVADDYDRYKYFFRVTPICNNHLVGNTLMEMGMAGAIMKQQTGIQRPLRAAICAEGAQWADAMVAAMEALIPARLGMEMSGTWRPSPTATELNAEMTAMEAANTDIIMPLISGPLGIPYARTWGELEIPAASVGINVEAQKDGFWDATGGFGNYDTTLNTYCEGVAFTSMTTPFIEAFKAKTGQMPTYTASTNDAVLMLAGCIERAGTLDADAVVAELEKWEEDGCGAHFKFTSPEDAPYGNPHDCKYGPGYATGIATQWQDGVQKAVWPNPDFASDEWKGVSYGGIVPWVAPPRVIDRLTAEAATEPPPEEEAPPEEGALSFEAATFTWDDPALSVQYPAAWAERPENVVGETVASFGIPAFIPGMSVNVADAYEFTEEALKASWEETNSDFVLLAGPTETTLADGTTPAVEYECEYVTDAGYLIHSFCVSLNKNDTGILYIIWTIDMYSPYDADLFREIADTLTVE